MSVNFKGALRYKRKTELLDIAHRLNFEIDESLKREELEVIIRDYLVAHRAALEPDPTFKGLFDSIDSGERRAARASTALSNESDASDEAAPTASAKTPRKHSQKKPTNGIAAVAATAATTAATPLRQVSDVAQDAAAAAVDASDRATTFASSLTARTKRSFENLADTFRGKADEAAADVHREANTLRRRASQNLKASRRRAIRSFEGARETASNATNITLAILVVEAAALLLNVTPTVYLEFGRRTAVGVLKSGAGKSVASGKVPQWAITLPDVRALLTVSFWRPLLLWTTSTALLPLAFAHLITFDRRHEPSVLTFNIVRLFVVILLASRAGGASLLSAHAVPPVLGVAAGQTSASAASAAAGGASYAVFGLDWVRRHFNPELEVLGSGLALAFSAYEIVASRPRAV